ncbi:MAG: paraquat-inducible protein A [Magnetococcales bacterium]|nr:paraquat-inducible protein A [Magnetococcales bacterium]
MSKNSSDLMNALVACHDCDALYRLPELPVGGVVRCERCGAELLRRRASTLDSTLAFSLTGLILFLIANLNPLLILKLGGRVQGNTLFAGVEALAKAGMWELAVLVFGTSMLFPLVTLVGMLYLLLPLKFGQLPKGAHLVLRLVNAVTPWAMVGVYMLGIFVAYVKLISMATVVPGMALYAFLGLLLVTAAARATLDPWMIWNRISGST